MDHNARIEAAITDLESQSRVNYAATAKEWDIDVQRCHGAIKAKRAPERTQPQIRVYGLQMYKKKLLLSILISWTTEAFHQPPKSWKISLKRLYTKSLVRTGQLVLYDDIKIN
jgi:hypothetical protein